MTEYESIGDIVLAATTKAGTSPELAYGRYESLCRRIKVLPLFGQWDAAVRRLLQSGQLYLDRSARTLRKR